MARTSCLSWGDNHEYDHPSVPCWTPWQRQTLNTLFLIYFLWYYNIYIDGFNKVGFYHSIYLVLTRMMGGSEYSQVYRSILLSFKYDIMVWLCIVNLSFKMFIYDNVLTS